MKALTLKPTMPVAVLTLAAAIAFGSYNLATTKQATASTGPSAVKIADGTTGALAKVSSAGALSASVTGSVTTKLGTPTTPLNLYTFGVPNSFSTLTELIHPTTAHVDLTALTVTEDAAENPDPVQVFFEIVDVPSGTTVGNCAADETSDSQLQLVEVQPGTTTTVAPASPIVMSPPSGMEACIGYYLSDATNSSDTGVVFVTATGFVSSGTYSGNHGIGGTAVRSAATSGSGTRPNPAG